VGGADLDRGNGCDGAFSRHEYLLDDADRLVDCQTLQEKSGRNKAGKRRRLGASSHVGELKRAVG
jgi:hypothetical protein